MKIRNIYVKSFGTLTNRHSGDIPDGLTLVYGKNESGKTTYTEFIRSTLFPVGRRQRYPSYDKSDSGTIVVEMDSGERRVYERKARKTKEANGAPLPGEELKMDADTYFSIYAMGLEQLVDSKLISDGEMRSRFLVVPGGEHVPEISDDINKSMLDLMNNSRLTANKGIGKTLAASEKADETLAELRESKKGYDALFEEKKSLEDKSTNLAYMDSIARSEEKRREVVLSQRENLNRYDSLLETRESLLPSSVTPDDEKKYGDLKANLERLENSMKVAEGKALPEELGGRNPVDVVSRSDEIEDAWEARSQIQVLEMGVADKNENIDEAEDLIAKYTSSTGWTEKAAIAADSGKQVVERAEKEAAFSPEAGGGKVRPMATVVVGLALMALGLISIFSMVASISDEPAFAYGIAAVGVAIMALGLYSAFGKREDVTDWDVWIREKGYPRGTTAQQVCILVPKLEMIKNSVATRDNLKVQTAEDVERISELKKRIDGPAAALDVSGDNYNDVANGLYNLLKAARNHQSASSVVVLDKEIGKIESDLSDFLTPWGDEETFLEDMGKSKRLREVEAEICNLKESIETSSKLEIDDLRELISGDAVDPEKSATETQVGGESLDSINKRIGEINASMNAIMDDGAIVKARADKAATEAKLKAECREWGVLSLAEHLITSAADHFYKDMQPDVVKTANKYLGMMTDGKYVLDDDPREKELCIWDGYNKKRPDQWSSGLGDQVMLSVKLAMAENMTRETLPVILDDVLVRFDSARKQGACRAIQEYAKDRQVIMFTCDSQLVSQCGLEGMVKTIELG